MIEIKDKSKCCGCWACANACPKNCITMVEDNEGFHYPEVNTESCIDCGLCNKACPELKPEMDDERPINYTVQHKDTNVRRHSTSGGFFTAISRWVIEQGGVVFGAAFDEHMVLRHQYAETLDECAKFRGSKYVQSLVGDSYKKVKNFLAQGRVVVFSGTPCQVAGLMGFLGNRKYEGLVTVDLVCHGTPSPLLLKEYFSYHSSQLGSTPVGYFSRDKHYSYSYSTATIEFKDKKVSYHKGKDSDFMLGLYFKDLISRPSCYKCHFKTLNRVSDFTIFDCWDAPSVSDKLDRSGATNVFIHSEKGNNIFEQLKSDFVWAQGDIVPIIKRDGVMIKNRVTENPLRSQLFAALNNGMSIPEIEEKYNHKSIIKKLVSAIKPLMYKIGVFDLYMKIK